MTNAQFCGQLLVLAAYLGRVEATTKFQEQFEEAIAGLRIDSESGLDPGVVSLRLEALKELLKAQGDYVDVLRDLLGDDGSLGVSQPLS
jgi:saccharopine dehydrogenase-like NADP-dependent oxidoreductase